MRCAECGKDISGIEVARHRIVGFYEVHLPYCNRKCLRDWRVRTGFYKDMSNIGAEHRSTALKLSNRLHPRRKRT